MKSRKSLTNLLLAAILLFTVFGCKSFNLPLLGGGGVSESTDPKEAIMTAYKKFMEQKSYYSTSISKNAQNEMQTEVEYVAPDRYRLKNNIPNFKSEFLIIGADTYSRINDGKWNRASQTIPVTELRGKMTDEALAGMKDFELAGRETIDGKETVVFKFKNTYAGESSSKMWISPDSGLPLRVDTEGSYSGVKVQVSINYDYDRQISIEVPKVD